MNRPESGMPGRLIAVEGVDGSGKSTQIDLLHKWLVGLGCRALGDEEAAAMELEAARAGLRRLAGRGVVPAPRPSDAQLLSALGIDLDAIVGE